MSISLELLPDAVQQIILSYLSLEIRLNVLHQKYPTKMLIQKLTELPKNLNTFDKLYHLISLSEPILTELYEENMIDMYFTDIFCECPLDFRYTLRMLKNKSDNYYYKQRVELQTDIKNGIDIDYCINYFINIIICTFETYSIMYKKDLPEWHTNNEKIMLKVLLHILR
jgi:hypothetical protein